MTAHVQNNTYASKEHPRIGDIVKPDTNADFRYSIINGKLSKTYEVVGVSQGAKSVLIHIKPYSGRTDVVRMKASNFILVKASTDPLNQTLEDDYKFIVFEFASNRIVGKTNDVHEIESIIAEDAKSDIRKKYSVYRRNSVASIPLPKIQFQYDQ